MGMGNKRCVRRCLLRTPSAGFDERFGQRESEASGTSGYCKGLAEQVKVCEALVADFCLPWEAGLDWWFAVLHYVEVQRKLRRSWCD